MDMISVISPLFVKVCQLFRNLFAPDLATIGCSWLLRSFFPFLGLPQHEPSILSLLTMLNSYELQPIRFGGFYAAWQLVTLRMHEDPLRMLKSESMKPSLMEMIFLQIHPTTGPANRSWSHVQRIESRRVSVHALGSKHHAQQGVH